MTPRDCFGIIVRTIGLVLLLAGLYHLLFGLVLLCFGSRLVSEVVLFAFGYGVPATIAGVYLLRGAPDLIAFSYPPVPSSRSSSSTPVA